MYKTGDKITIGKEQYVVLFAVDVTDNQVFLKQENVTQTLAIEDANGVHYSCKAYGNGNFSYPKKMLTQKDLE
jgi:hypothetical protein